LRIEWLERALVIGWPVKNGLPQVASGGEEIKRAGEFETRRPGHEWEKCPWYRAKSSREGVFCKFV